MASNNPKAKEFVRNKLTVRIREGLERELRPHLAGSRPVRRDIVVRNFTVAPAVQRIIIGGHHRMVADANVVDAATGATLLTFPNVPGIPVTGAGVAGVAPEAAIGADQANRVIASYGRNYAGYLRNQ